MLVRRPIRVPHLRLAGLAVCIGLAAGGAAWVLVHIIGLFTNVFLFRRWGWEVPDFSTLDRSPWVVFVAVAGAGVVTLLALWAPTIRGHGIPEARRGLNEEPPKTIVGRYEKRPTSGIAAASSR